MIPEWIVQLIALAAGASIGALLPYYQVPRLKRLFTTAAIILVPLSIGMFAWNEHRRNQAERRKPIYFGELTPAASHDDPSILKPPLNCVALLLGEDLRLLAAHSENTVLAVHGQPLITIGLREGRLRLTARVLDSQGRNMVSIIDNEFQVDPQNAFLPRRPDPYSLVVRDLYGVEVLNLRYVSPRVVALKGRFYAPGLGGPVEILNRGGIRWPGGGGITGLTIDMTRAKGGFLSIQ